MIHKRSRGKYKTAKEYHDMKTKRCEKKEFKLIHIDEEDYINNKEQVLNFIKDTIEERKI